MTKPTERAPGFYKLLNLRAVWSPVGVVDFLDVGIGELRWPTFNFADVAISIGAVLLAWVLWNEERETETVVRA